MATTESAALKTQPPRDFLQDATVLITGCNTGLGAELARGALAAGARLLFTCRTDAKVSATADALRADFPHAHIRGYRLDLSVLADVDEVAGRLARAGIHVDALILNAGVHVPFANRQTDDGHELHHQVNFLAPARLFLRLAEHARPPRRVLYVSSDAHQRGHLPAVFPLNFWARYARSKLLATSG